MDQINNSTWSLFDQFSYNQYYLIFNILFKILPLFSPKLLWKKDWKGLRVRGYMLFVCILYQDMMVYFKTIQNGSPLFDVELYHTVHKTLIVSTLLNRE